MFTIVSRVSIVVLYHMVNWVAETETNLSSFKLKLDDLCKDTGDVRDPEGGGAARQWGQPGASLVLVLSSCVCVLPQSLPHELRWFFKS